MCSPSLSDTLTLAMDLPLGVMKDSTAPNLLSER